MDTLRLVSSFIGKKRGKAFSIVLSLTLVISLMPFSAFAENSSDEKNLSGTERMSTANSTLSEEDASNESSSDQDPSASTEGQENESEEGTLEEETSSDSSDDQSITDEEVTTEEDDVSLGDEEADEANTSDLESDALEEEAEEEEKEVAVSLSQTIDGVTVSVVADEGVFPEGTTLNVTSLASSEAEMIAEARAEAMGRTLVQYHAFDVTLYDKDGAVVQPDGVATVSFANAGAEGTETILLHSSSSIENVSKIADGTSADVDHFSPFMILSTTWTDDGTNITVTNQESNILGIDTLDSANQKYSVLATFVTDEGQWYLLLGVEKIGSDPQVHHPIDYIEIDGVQVYTGPIDPNDWRETFTFTGINGVPVTYDDANSLYYPAPIDQAPPAGVEFAIFGNAGQGGAGGFDIDGTYIFAAQQLNIYHVFDQGLELDPLSGSGYASQELTIPSWQRTGWVLDYITLTVGNVTTVIPAVNGNAVFDYDALVGATVIFYYAELPQYNVHHEFVSDSADPLPQSVLDLVPPDYLAYDGSTVFPSDFQPKSVGTIDGTWNFVGWSPDSQVIDGEDVTFTGTWTFVEGVYTVTGVIDHGTVSPDFQTVNSGDPSEAVDFTAADGYQIVKATVYIDGVGTDDTSMAGDTTWTYPSVDELRNSITIVVVTEEIEYPITYVLNGGTNDPANPSSYMVTTPDISLNDATRFGHTFEGWFIDEQFIFPAGDPAIPTGSTGPRTFYALWAANEDVNYTVHYYQEGTTTSVAPDKEVTDQTFGTTVSENAIDVVGYTALEPTTQDLLLDDYGKEIVFYYSLNMYEVDHMFISGTPGHELPQEILDELPGSYETHHGEEVVPGTFAETALTTDEGTWTFEAWDAESVIVDDSNVLFTGTWIFEADPAVVTTTTTTTTTTFVDDPPTTSVGTASAQTSDGLQFAVVLLGAFAVAALSVVFVSRRSLAKQDGNTNQ